MTFGKCIIPFPKSGIEKLATYHVQTTRELEDREIRETSVYSLAR